MSTYKAFQNDSNLEKTGIELDLGSAGVFVIARAGGANDRFKKRFEALTKPHRRSIQTETIEEGVSQGILRQVYAECVVLGWTGVTGPDGEPLEYSTDNAKQLFEDLPDLFLTIQQSASDGALFRKHIREIDGKNL